jgi:hypothetical protein
MPTIHLTQKLQKEIGLKPTDLVQTDESNVPFAEWYAHVFLIDRKKHVMFVERQTLFSFTCENVSRKDLRERLPELFEKRLGKALFVEGASGEVIKAVMDACRGEVRYAKTQNRQMIASTTEFIRHYAWSFEDGYSFLEADQRNRRLPVRGFPDKSQKYKFSIEVFALTLKKEFGLDFKPVREDVTENDLVPVEDFMLDEESAQAMTYVFDVRMVVVEGDALHGTTREVIREIAVACDQSLARFAEAIFDAFGFECDHCFGFYTDIKRKRGIPPKEIYEAFVDAGVETVYPHAQSVEKMRIVEVFNDIGKQMRFVFDYGEDWEFLVTFVANYPPKQGQKLPCVLKSFGEAPEQYPQCEDGD